MSEERDPVRELEQELAAEQVLRNKAHRYMGMAAAILGLLAIIVALARMRTMFGVSPLKALGLGFTGIPWVVILIGLGVAISLGTTRLLSRTGRKQNHPKHNTAGK